MDPQRMARKYRQLDDGGDIESNSRPNFRQPMHDERETGTLSIMNSMFSAQRYEKKGRETEGFKLAVLQWSSAYAVAYSLMMTIAFALLMTKPLPQPLLPPEEPFWASNWRPRYEVLDHIVPLLYYFFSAAACADSAWGMLMCAEWGVRGGALPADLYERFVRHLSPDASDPDMQENSMWVWRCCEPRAAHEGLRYFGFFFRCLGCPGVNLGLFKSPSWDPFYFVDRTVMTLFLASACLVYLNSGMLPAMLITFFYLLLRERVRSRGQSVLHAMFRTLSDAAQEDGVELTEAERAHTSGNLFGARASERWKKGSSTISSLNAIRQAAAKNKAATSRD